MGFDDGSARARNIRGWNSSHRRSDPQDDLEGVLHVSMDYGFLGGRESEEQVTLVRGHPRTETQDDVGDAGSKKRNGISLDSMESSEGSLTISGSGATTSRRLRHWRGKRTSSPRGKPECPGETTSGSMQWGPVAGQDRTLKAALEHRIGTRILPDSRILSATERHSCGSMSERTTHRSWNSEEKILYMPAKPARGGKWERRFHPGVFVGLLNSSSEAVVVTETRASSQDTRSERQENS